MKRGGCRTREGEKKKKIWESGGEKKSLGTEKEKRALGQERRSGEEEAKNRDDEKIGGESGENRRLVIGKMMSTQGQDSWR